MLIAINQWIEHTQYVMFALVATWLWFHQENGRWMLRQQAIVVMMAVLFSHVLVHIQSDWWFHGSPPAFFHPTETIHQGWEAFYLQWFIAPSSMATWMAFSVAVLAISRMAGLLLCLLSLFIAWLHLMANLAWPSDVLLALFVGAVTGWALVLLSRHMQRFTYGIEQLSIHIPQVIYPLMLLLMIDMSNDLQFLTFSFHFMFGGSK